jgi:hypothetical protein
MDNLGDMVERLQRKLVSSDSSTQYTEAILKDLIADAYVWGSQLVPWKDLTVVFETSTEAGVFWYDYPVSNNAPSPFVTDSITFLEIDTGDGLKEYHKKDFQDFIRYKRENANSESRRIFADNERKWFCFPIPQVTGSWNVTVHGQKHADPLLVDSDTTIFTNMSKDGNQAIVEKAFSDAIYRVDPKLSKMSLEDATGLLLRIFKRERDNQQLNQRLDHPRFDVPDMFRQQGGYTPQGDFNYSDNG